LGFTPSAGKELQSEYFVPGRMQSKQSLLLNASATRSAVYLLISKIRAIAADNLWMSPCTNLA